MNSLFENKFYRLLLLIATLVAILAYAYLGSRMLEPRLVLPQSISAAFIVESGKVERWTSVFNLHPMVLTKALREVESFEDAISLVGGLQQPVDLIVNFDEPTRYLVTDSRVEIGVHWTASDGQLAKALTKAWIAQRTRPDISASLLRTEVVSDLLWAMLNGGLNIDRLVVNPDESLKTSQAPQNSFFIRRFALPREDKTLRFPSVSHWFLYATSFQNHCDSGWMIPELYQLCHNLRNGSERTLSGNVTAVGFRPMLGSMVWSVFEKLPLLERVDFIKSWAQQLSTGTAQAESSRPETRPETIADWDAWLQAEFDILLPGAWLRSSRSEFSTTQTLSPLRSKKIQSLSQASLEKAGLAKNMGFVVDVMFKSQEAKDLEIKTLADIIQIGNDRLWTAPKVAVIETELGWMMLPGMGQVLVGKNQPMRIRQFVWEACEAPSFENIVQDTVTAQRVLYVESCGKALHPSYSPLFTLGIKGFAAANPKVAFAQLRIPSLELATSKRLLTKTSILSDLVKGPGLIGLEPQLNKKTGAPSEQQWSPHLGLQNAKWDSELKAYRVLGAIEAVEWYRNAAQSAQTGAPPPQQPVQDSSQTH